MTIGVEGGGREVGRNNSSVSGGCEPGIILSHFEARCLRVVKNRQRLKCYGWHWKDEVSSRAFQHRVVWRFLHGLLQGVVELLKSVQDGEAGRYGCALLSNGLSHICHYIYMCIVTKRPHPPHDTTPSFSSGRLTTTELPRL